MTSRVVLDLPPGWALALTAAVPLSTLILGRAISAALKLVPRSSNPFALPPDGIDEKVDAERGRRTWKHWSLAALGVVHALVWAAFGVQTAVAQGGAGWKTATQLGLVSLGWVRRIHVALNDDMRSTDVLDSG